jgi:hypothetical protein
MMRCECHETYPSYGGGIGARTDAANGCGDRSRRIPEAKD